MKNEIISLFSTPIVKTNIGRSFTKEETDCIANIPMGKDKSPTVQMQSECFDIFDNFTEELNDIKSFCEHELKRYLEEVEGVDTERAGLRITQSWLTKLKPQEFHALHNHRNSYLSGILYISCLPNDNIQFRDRYRFFDPALEFPKKKRTEYNAEGVAVNIEVGDLIIFPSLVLHQVSVNETKDKERISLSFDTFPTYLPSLYPPFK